MAHTAHEFHEFPRIKKTFVHRLHGFTLISIFRRGAPPCAPFPPHLPSPPRVSVFHLSIAHPSFDKLTYAQSNRSNSFIPYDKSPKPAQGMIHTLSLAPLGFMLTTEQSNIHGCTGTGDTGPAYRPFPTHPKQVISPVPLQLYFFYAVYLKPPILEPTVGAFWVIWMGIQITYGRQDNHLLRPPAVFYLQKSAAKVPAGQPKKAKDRENKNLYLGVPWCLGVLVAKIP
jgi:hypothetical protein